MNQIISPIAAVLIGVVFGGSPQARAAIGIKADTNDPMVAWEYRTGDTLTVNVYTDGTADQGVFGIELALETSGKGLLIADVRPGPDWVMPIYVNHMCGNHILALRYSPESCRDALTDALAILFQPRHPFQINTLP
jgi:hypothetical protein